MQKIKNLGQIFKIKKLGKTQESGFKPINPETHSRYKRVQKKTPKLITLTRIFGPILLVVVLLLLLLKSPIFSITNIKCTTQYSLCSDQDQLILKTFKGENLIFLNSSDVESKITKSFANRKIVVQKVFPGTLTVFLERRKPVVAVKPDQGQFLVDNDGVVVEYAQASALPTVILTSNKSPLVVGESVDENTLQAIKIMELVYKSQNINQGSLQDEELDITLQNGILVKFPLDRDPKALVGALQLITARIRIDGKVPKSIDLRYSNPVLSY